MKIGDVVLYRGEPVTIKRASFPRFGRIRVKVKRERDGRTFVVNLDHLREMPATAPAEGE